MLGFGGGKEGYGVMGAGDWNGVGFGTGGGGCGG
jgi:hypothetical protein